jgi:cytochrome c peroxidase
MTRNEQLSDVRTLSLLLAGAVVSATMCAGCFLFPSPASPVPPTKVSVGKLIFFDTNLSAPSGQSCASCHDPNAGFAHPDATLPVSVGAVASRFGERNAPTAAYAAFIPPLHYDPNQRPGIMEGMYVGGLFWDGRAATLEDQAKGPFVNPLEMNCADSSSVVEMVRSADYAALFEEVFGPNSLSEPNTAFEHIAEAIAEYERSDEVSPFSSKYDQSLDGNAVLTDQEARGLALFTGKAKCKNCHSTDPGPTGKPLFTNFGHQNIGVPKNPGNPFYALPPLLNPDGPNWVDLGLGELLGDPNQDGKFKIPTLRNVAVTAPYMHNGVFNTLREVVVFDNTRDVAEWAPPEVPRNVHRHMPPMPGTFGQLGLTDQEIDDIVAFLETLTDGWQP